MKLTFPRSAELKEISAAIDKLGTPDRRAMVSMMPDGSYRLVGSIVKDPDCPQKDFDWAMEQLAEHNKPHKP